MTELSKPLTHTLLALAVCGLLSACGGGSAGAPPGSGSGTTATTPAAQTISFSSPGNQTLGTAPPALSATASSGLTVSFSSSTAAVCTVSGTALTLVSAGSCTVAADQAGNTSYAAAPQQTVTFTVAAASSSASALTFSSGFASAGLTHEGGLIANYGGSNLDGYACSGAASCGSGAGGTGASTYYYAYYQTPSPATALYMGASILAPGVSTPLSSTGDTAGVQLNGQTTLDFTFNQNAEWASSGNSNFAILLTLGKHYSVNGGACNIKLQTVLPVLNGGASAAYTVPLAAFAVTQNCGTTISTVTDALASAPVAQIDFQGDGGTAALTQPGTNLSTGANLTVANTATPPVYPTTVALAGPITFGVEPANQAQTISFSSPGAQTVGTTPPALAATSSSGLSVAIASSTPAVCTVSGSTLSLVAAGSCSLTASQTGNGSYAPATPVTTTFTVSSGSVATLTFSSGFASAGLTNEGGRIASYGGSNLDGWNCASAANCGSGAGGTGASTYYYAYYQTSSPAAGLYNGASILAPGVSTPLSTTGDTPGVQISGQTSLNFTFNQNPEWITSGTNNFAVLLTLGKYYSVNGGACNIKLQSVVTPLNGGASAAYALPLSGFAVTQNCGTSLNTVAAALASAPVAQIDFQGDGGTAKLVQPGTGLTSGANLSVANTATPPVYPTTVALTGAITFAP